MRIVFAMTSTARRRLLQFILTLCVMLTGIVAAGLSGLTFQLWPTSLADQELHITLATLQQLAALKAQRKFEADPATFYPGARDEMARAAAQAEIDATIDALIQALPHAPRRSTVLALLKTALARIDTPESEERDQCLVYFQRILQIVGVERSGELFNVWRYGFPYGWLLPG